VPTRMSIPLFFAEGGRSAVLMYDTGVPVAAESELATRYALSNSRTGASGPHATVIGPVHGSFARVVTGCAYVTRSGTRACASTSGAPGFATIPQPQRVNPLKSARRNHE